MSLKHWWQWRWSLFAIAILPRKELPDKVVVENPKVVCCVAIYDLLVDTDTKVDSVTTTPTLSIPVWRIFLGGEYSAGRCVDMETERVWRQREREGIG
jgi:hypothetical protein